MYAYDILFVYDCEQHINSLARSHISTEYEQWTCHFVVTNNIILTNLTEAIH